ncbi:MAG: BamA/TamA family outer membrane protein [Bacteroidota bacterium]
MRIKRRYNYLNTKLLLHLSAQGCLLFSLLLVLLLSSCGTKKYLEPGQSYLTKNTVKFETRKKLKDKRGLSYDLKTIYKQKPNEKFLRLFRARLWLYHKFNNPNKSSKFRNWILNKIAELPAIYDEELADATAQTMKYFLQNRGYYDAKVSFAAKHRRKKTEVIYTVQPEDLYTVDTVNFVSSDEQVQRILDDISAESFIKQGQPVSESIFDREKGRITNTLKNLGYAFFDHNFIEPIGYVDTAKHLVNVVYEVLPQRNGQDHQIYTVGSIEVTPRYLPAEYAELKDSVINNVLFHINAERPFIKPETIQKAIMLRPGELFRKDNLDRTNRLLSNLEIYKFISVKPIVDTVQTNVINFEIRLTPKDRMVLGWDVETNTSNYSISTNGSPLSLIGMTGKVNFRHRNVFRNATILSAEFLAGSELDLGNNFSVFSLDVQANFDIFIPKYKGVTGFWRGLNALGLVSDRFYDKLRENAKTRFSLGYNNFSNFNLYSYNSLDFNRGFDLQLSPENRVRINTSGINYFSPRFTEFFQDSILDFNPFLERSFDRQLFTGFLFRDVNFAHTGKRNRFGQSWFFGASFELSGFETLLINRIYNNIADRTGPFSIDQVNFEQYIRLELDGRYYRRLSNRNSLAARLNIGLARPYGPYSQETPYVKQFAVGGPNSIRAWNLREIGPGAFLDPDATDNIFFQAADFKIEFGLEYRFDLIYVFEGAIFLDGGNIWAIDQDDPRGSEALLTNRFYEDFALGTGIGLRVDIKYAILRFDFGLKMRQPFTDPDDPTASRWLFNRWSNLNDDLFNLNLAIGYPF